MSEVSIDFEQKFSLAMPKEETFLVREKDWVRLRRRIDAAQKHRKEFAAVGWACVGVSASALFSGIAWEPAYRVLPSDLRPDFAWVWPAIVLLGAAGLVIATAMFWAAHVTKGAEGVSIQEVLEDMDEIRPPARVTSPGPLKTG